MHRAPLAVLLALAATLAPAAPAPADGASLEASLSLGLVAVQDAARLLLQDQRAEAVVSLDAAVSFGEDAVDDAADPGTVAELGTLAAKAGKKAAAFVKAATKARDAMANPNLAELAAVKASMKASKAGYAALGVLRGFPSAGPAVVELGAKTAGFHEPGDLLEFRIHPGRDAEGQPCLEEPQVAVIDPFGNGSVLEGYEVVASNADGSFDIEVVMGDNGGPARVEVTSCGVTRRWLLFNYGPTGTFAPKPEVDRFDGAYTGSFTGTGTAFGENFPVDGGVAFTVAGGVITVTDPGNGVGNLSARGSAGFAGAGGTFDAAYTFGGKFTATALGTGPGTAVASGSWTATFEGGTARGTWSAGR